MYAFLFSISFSTAHFKLHTSKRFRDSYMIPLPSTLAGILGAIAGIKRRNLPTWSEDIFVGAKLVDYKGEFFELAKLWKFKGWNLPISTIERIKVLINPKYVVGVASPNKEKIEDLYYRLQNRHFEFIPYGGNDYHLVEDIGDVTWAKHIKAKEGEGYAPRSLINTVKQIDSSSVVLRTAYVRASRREYFVFVWRGIIVTKTELDVVHNGNHRIFVYKAKDFISI